MLIRIPNMMYPFRDFDFPDLVERIGDPSLLDWNGKIVSFPNVRINGVLSSIDTIDFKVMNIDLLGFEIRFGDIHGDLGTFSGVVDGTGLVRCEVGYDEPS